MTLLADRVCSRPGDSRSLRTLVALMLAVFLSACGAAGSGPGPGGGDGDGGVGPGEDGGGGFDDGGGTLRDARSAIDPDAFWAQDPPPAWCGPDGGGTPPTPPGGTVECPDDKNRQGCPCSPVGQQAACWPGLRANRNLGICKDGVTTCTANDEFDSIWGPCIGYVLPDPNATKGKAACKCFSAGQWKIDNLSPCFVTYNGTQVYAVSTYIDAGGQAQCPSNISQTPPPAPQPGESFSTNTLQVDCAGHFKLCYTLKAGDATQPQPTDCVLATVCTEADYPVENEPFTMPDLPAWNSNDTSCAAQFSNSGGYGEMTVIGLSVLCDEVDDGNGNPYVFNRVQYCPLSCNDNPTAPGCENCQQGGSGTF